jgi:hypothetical protein
MRILTLSLVLASAFISSALAETFKLPENNPVASFSIPDSWKPSETDAGIEAASVDGEIYLSIEYADADSMNDVIDNTIKFLDKQGVKVGDKPSSTGDSTLNGMKISHMAYKGTDKDGPCEVSLSFVSVVEGKALVITYWGSADAANKHKDSLEKIVGSIEKI